MMPQTPRTFVGSIVLALECPADPQDARRVHAAVTGVPGVRSCELAFEGAALVVTAAEPVDRAEVLAALDRVGCPVRT